MPKKILPIVIVAIVVILGVGAYFVLGQKGTSDTQNDNGQGGNVISSIKDALSKAVSLECNYDDADAGTKVTAYIKNGAIRTNYTGASQSESGSVIMKDRKMYFWNSEGAFVMNIPDEEELKEAEGQAPQGGSNPDEVIGGIEKYKESCKPAVVSDSLFTPPSDIKFQDFSQLMEGMMQQEMEDQGTPADPRNTPSQEEIQRIMEQYQQSQN